MGAIINKIRLSTLALILVSLQTGLLTLVQTQTASAAELEFVRAMTDSSGSEGNTFSDRSDISGDGRYVVYISNSTNLVPGDTNVEDDIFLKDTQTGNTERISVDSLGNEANGTSWGFAPSISSDGRYIAFYSQATNLVAGDTNTQADIFVRDRQTNTTTRVNVGPGGVEANSWSSRPAISSNGRYVLFMSAADNLVFSDTNAATDVFVHDLHTSTTSRVSVSDTETEASLGGDYATISGDGQYVLFYSDGDDLVAADANGASDFFIRDTVLGTTTLIPQTESGAEPTSRTTYASLSRDGRYFLYESSATNVITGDTNGQTDIFVRDIQAGTVKRVSISSGSNETNNGSYLHTTSSNMSYDGRYIVFESYATNLTDESDTNSAVDIFLHDQQLGETILISKTDSGTTGNFDSYYSVISGDGKVVSFTAYANDLVTGDTNGMDEILVAIRGDNDNIANSVEDDAPNNGDNNGDGTADSLQSHVSSTINSVLGAYTTLEIDNVTDCYEISFYQVVDELDNATQDADYDYPFGLNNFTIQCTNPGDTATINWVLDDTYDTSTWTFRKYIGSEYTDIPLNGVSFSTRVVGAQNRTVISYSITDGGIYDEDGVANGTIVDPSGLAILGITNETVTSDQLADTGNSAVTAVIVGSVAIAMVFALANAVQPKVYRLVRR